jgi:hypothetical protein
MVGRSRTETPGGTQNPGDEQNYQRRRRTEQPTVEASDGQGQRQPSCLELGYGRASWVEPEALAMSGEVPEAGVAT